MSAPAIIDLPATRQLPENRPALASQPSRVEFLWVTLMMFCTASLLYVENDFPDGFPADGSSASLVWPLVYTVATFILAALLMLSTRRPISPIRGVLRRLANPSVLQTVLTLLAFLFYAITAVALTRKLARGGFSVDELAQTAILVAGGLVLLVAAWRRPSIMSLLILATVLGIVTRAIAISLVPLEYETVDMLPLVEAANRSLLAGDSPYQVHTVRAWQYPLLYLPGMWLAYLPAVVLKIDLRSINIIADVVVLWSLAYAAASRGDAGRMQPPVESLVGLLFFLSPIVITFDIYTEFPTFWLILVLVYAALIQRHWVVGAVLWGISLATSLLMLVASPFIALFLARNMPPSRSWKYFLAAALSCLALFLPFFIWSPRDFLAGPFVFINSLNDAGAIHWVIRNKEQLFSLGFSGWFWYVGWQSMLVLVQALLLGSIFLWYLWKGRQTDWLLPVIPPYAYAAFIFFNPIIAPYYYIPLLPLLALVAIRRARHTSPDDPPRNRWAAHFSQN